MEFNDFSDQLTELHNISIELSKTESFDILCLKAIEMGQKKLGFERLSFWYVDSENTNYLKGSFGTDEVGHIRDERDVRLLIDQSDVNAKLLSGITHIIYMEDHDLFNNKGEVVGRGEIAIVGLWDGNKYIGSISCDNLLTGTPISKHQRDLLLIYGRTLGNQSSLKIAEEELKSHARFENILKEITRVSIEQTELKEMVYTLENLLRHLFNGKSARLYLNDEVFSSIFPFTPGEIEIFKKFKNIKEKVILSNMYGFKSMLLLPFSDYEKHNGLVLIGLDVEHIFSRDEIARGEQAAWQIALAIQKAKLFEETRRLSIIDELTGINNRRIFFQLAEREIQRSIRKKTVLSLIMLDIDHFKNINDTFGHRKGDSVLKDVSAKLQEGLREVDILGRYGGEEFIILLTDTDLAEAKIVTERLLQSIRNLEHSLSLTISGGISQMRKTNSELSTLIEEADAALYEAKRQGRDRFEVYLDQ